MVPNLEDLDWRELESSGFPTSDDQKQRVIAALNDYLTDSTIFQKAPTEKEVRNRLESIERFSSRLAKLVSDSTEEGQAALSLCFPFHRSDPNTLGHLLYELSGNSKAASQDLQDGRGGALGNPPLRQLIRQLHDLFLENGGAGVGAHWDPYCETCAGPFFVMVKEILDLAGIPYTSEGSLLQSIRRAFKESSLEPQT